MNTVTSADGTTLAYERVGEGPPLVLVDGAFCGRTFGPMRDLAKALRPRFTVVVYDRRGRGDSQDTPPYAVEREIEDLGALVTMLGGEAFVYGTSSGAVLAARAVAAGVQAKRLVMYEPPLALDGTHHPQPPDFVERIAALVAEDRRADAVKLFMRVVGVPAIGIFFMRLIPGVFGSLRAAAHALPHEFAVLGDTQRGGPLPEELEQVLESITAPTLVLSGGKSPPWLGHAARRVAQSVADGHTAVVAGQDHNVSAKAVAPHLIRFFLDDAAAATDAPGRAPTPSPT